MNETRLGENFRENLVAVMAERRLSVRTLGDMSGVSFVAISNIRTGRTKNVTIETCEKICRALRVRPEQMLGRKKSKKGVDRR